MLNKLPCLYKFISTTKEGDRNTNLFKAINHLTHYNQTATIEDIVKEALSINKAFTSPLNEQEVTVVCQHAIQKDYHTSCWKFRKYCQHCRYINENNRLVGIKLIEDDMYYPWDILDTTKLSDGDKLVVQRFREEMGIPIAIDSIVKSYGIPVGDKAKREWEKFRRS